MVIEESEIRMIDGLMLMDVPKKCVTALICGPRALPETATLLRAKAKQLGCNYFDMKIGRNSVVPFFIDPNGIKAQIVATVANDLTDFNG